MTLDSFFLFDQTNPELLGRILLRMRDDVAFACKLSHLHDDYVSDADKDNSGEQPEDRAFSGNRLSKKAPTSLRDLTDHVPDYALPLLPASPAHLWKTLPDSVKSAYRATSEILKNTRNTS